ncbi:MAG: 4'-phosphopantetheinyl transferase superfamily protein [Desulfobulbus oligotrophicus]|nr:4'-phosphopantetheinyl transferase superfamily protein [Desulfobulbus oligotrophicus]
MKTTTYPSPTRHYLEVLLADIRTISTRWQMFAPFSCYLALLNLHLLRPLLERDRTENLLTCLLSPAELNIFHGFSYDKRQLEWLGGRIAAKYALQAMSCSTTPAPHMYSILPDRHGRPHIAQKPTGCPAVTVSIAHSSGYAAALACSKGSCGVDIQQKTPTLYRVQKRFAQKEELQAFDPSPLPPLTRLGLLWSAKEAVKKCFLPDHPSFLSAIRFTSAYSEQNNKIWIGQCSLSHTAHDHATVRMGEMDQHLIACTWGENNA